MTKRPSKRKAAQAKRARPADSTHQTPIVKAADYLDAMKRGRDAAADGKAEAAVERWVERFRAAHLAPDTPFNPLDHEQTK